MAKITKEEMKNRINGLEIDDDTKISLLEDIEDSMDTQAENSETVDKATYDSLQADYDALKQKYKERFLTKTEETKTEDESAETDESDENVVDVKEI